MSIPGAQREKEPVVSATQVIDIDIKSSRKHGGRTTNLANLLKNADNPFKITHMECRQNQPYMPEMSAADL